MLYLFTKTNYRTKFVLFRINYFVICWFIFVSRLKKIQDKKKIASKKKELLKVEMKQKEAEYGNMLDEGDEDLLF